MANPWVDVGSDNEWQDVGTPPGSSIGAPALPNYQYSPAQMQKMDSIRAGILANEASSGTNTGPQSPSTQGAMDQELNDQINSYTKSGSTVTSGVDKGQSKADILKNENPPSNNNPWQDVGTDKANSNPWQDVGTTPDTIPYMASQALSLPRSVLGMAIQGAGSVANAIGGLVGHPDIADTMIKAGDAVNDPTNLGTDTTIDPDQTTSGLTDQQLQNPTEMQQVTGMAASVPAYLATGGAAPIVAGATSLWNTGTNLLNQGVDIDTAQKAALSAGATTGAAMALPLVGKGFLPKVAVGVAANAGSGAINDKVLNSLLETQYPDIAKNYQWDDLSKRVPEAVFGGMFGGGLHIAEKTGMLMQFNSMAKAYYGNVKDQAAMDSFLTPHIAELQTFLGDALDGRTKFQPPEGKTAGQYFQEILKPTEDGTPHPDATVQNILDLYSQIPEMSQSQNGGTSTHAPMAQYLGMMARGLGLDQVPVINNKGTIRDDPEQKGTYNPPDAQNNIPENITLNTGADHTTVLHEIGHAFTEQAVRLYENQEIYKQEGQTPPVLDPDMQAVVDRVAPLAKIYDFARPLATGMSDGDLQKLFDDPYHPDLNQQEKFYGWKSLHEFASEFLGNKNFRKQVGDIPIKRDDLSQLYPNRNERYQARNVGVALKNAIKNVYGAPITGTLIDPIFDHISNIMEASTNTTRSDNARNEQVSEANQSTATKLKQGFNDAVTNGMLLRVKRVLDQSGDDLNMFTTRLAAESISSPTWKEFVKNNAANIMANKPTFDQMMETRTDYQNLRKGEQRYTTDPRTIDELMPQIAKNYLDENSRVIKSVFGKDDITTFGEHFDVPQMFASEKAKRDTVPGQTIKWLVDQGRDYISLGNKLRSQMLEHYQDYNNLTRVDKKNLWSEIISMNTIEGRANLKARGLQWATPDMLEQRGMNPDQIKAYEGLTKGADFGWELTNQVLRRQGLPDLERIPGWFPHVWTGAYKVFVDVTKPNGDKYTSLVLGRDTRRGAEKIVQAVESGKYDNNGNKYSINYDNAKSGLPYRVRGTQDMSSSFSSSMYDFMNSYMGQMKSDPDVLQALQNMEQDAMLGVSRHMMENSDVGGFIGDAGIKDSILERLGIGDPRNNKILTLYENYAHSVTEYYRNTMFMSEVLGPLMNADTDLTDQDRNYGELFKNTPKFNSWVRDYGFNYLGHPLNKLAVVDNVVNRMLTYGGLDPNLGRTVVGFLRNSMSKVKLRMNLGFYQSSVFQPAMVMSMLDLASVQRSLEGAPMTSGVYTFGKVLKQLSTGSLDKDQIAAKQWAQENHILDENVEQAMQGKTLTPLGDFANTVTGGKINPVIEKWGRGLAFITAYTHMRDVYPDREMALQAARNITDMTMVNYSRENRPLFFQSYGLTGKSLSPFAVFRNAYMNNMEMALEMIAKNPTKIKAYVPLGTFMASFTMIAGVVGTLGFEEYNHAADLLNKIWPKLGLMHMDALLMKAHVPDWLTFGGISSLNKLIPGMSHGVNVSSSLGAPSPQTLADSPLVEFTKAMIDGGMWAGSNALYKLGVSQIPAPANDLYQAAKTLSPTIAQGLVERIFQGKYANEGIGYKGGSMEGYIKRDPIDQFTHDVTGKMSINESRNRIAERQVSANDKVIADSVKDLTESAADTAMGISNIMTVDQASKTAMQLDPDLTLEQFHKNVWDVVLNRMTTQHYKQAGVDSAKSVREYYQRKAMGQ
ncbi:MAG: hypothetical protein ACYC9R_06465 [Nitrosotalea sp.]